MQKVKGVKVTRKVKIVKQKFCIKKTHVNNNCYELRSRAINNFWHSVSLRKLIELEFSKECCEVLRFREIIISIGLAYVSNAEN